MCVVIYNCFTDDKSSLSGPEINIDTIVLPSIAVCITFSAEPAKAYADAITLGLVIIGKGFLSRTVFGAIKLP